MRRLLRIFGNATALLSLVLCVLAVAMWVRSYVASDVLEVTRPDWNGGVRTTLGKIVVWRTFLPYRARGWSYGATRPPVYDRDSSIWRVGHFKNHSDVYWGQWELAAPFEYVVGLTLVYPAFWVFRRMRRTRVPGACERCGYDLRATPDRCPECGATPTAEAAVFGRAGG